MRLTGTWPLACALVALTGTQVLAQDGRNAGLAAKLADLREHVRRVPFSATIESTSQLVFPGADGHDADCGNAPMAAAVGTGSSDRFGLLWARHTHCVGATEFPADGPTVIPISGGRFELVDTDGRTILGQYRGRLLSTPNGGVGEVGPFGHWLVQGSACVSGGTRYARIVDDCAAGRFAPIRGMSNFNTVDTTLFFDQTLGLVSR